MKTLPAFVRFPRDALGKAAKAAFQEWRAGLTKAEKAVLHEGEGNPAWKRSKVMRKPHKAKGTAK